jgi:hypothetical protein
VIIKVVAGDRMQGCRRRMQGCIKVVVGDRMRQGCIVGSGETEGGTERVGERVRHAAGRRAWSGFGAGGFGPGMVGVQAGTGGDERRVGPGWGAWGTGGVFERDMRPM